MPPSLIWSATFDASVATPSTPNCRASRLRARTSTTASTNSLFSQVAAAVHTVHARLAWKVAAHHSRALAGGDVACLAARRNNAGVGGRGCGSGAGIAPIRCLGAESRRLCRAGCEVVSKRPVHPLERPCVWPSRDVVQPRCPVERGDDCGLPPALLQPVDDPRRKDGHEQADDCGGTEGQGRSWPGGHRRAGNVMTTTTMAGAPSGALTRRCWSAWTIAEADASAAMADPLLALTLITGALVKVP